MPTYGCVIKNESGVVVTDGTIELDASSSQASFAIVSMAAPATVASGAVVPFDTVKSDSDGYWNAGAHRFEVPVGKGGVFYVEAGLLGDNAALATGGFVQLGNSGADPNLQAPIVNVNGALWKGAGGSTIRLADGETVDCSLFVFTAAAMDADAGSHFSISRWGDL